MREVREETGYEARVLRITGIYTNPNHVIAYDDGEMRQQFSIAFAARVVEGHISTSSGSSEVKWVAPEELESYEIHPSMRLRIQHGLSGDVEPYIG